MSKELEARVWNQLRQVGYRGMSRDIVSFGFVSSVEIEGATAKVKLKIRTQDAATAEKARADAAEKLAELEGLESYDVKLQVETPPDPATAGQKAIARDPRLIPGVNRVVAVASGKGGVGKSTVAVNLAISLAKLGHSVGILDADIYGPSLPMMMGVTESRPRVAEDGGSMLPFDAHGVKVMSLGFILEVDTPVIWRGPMVMKAIEQLLGDVEWGVLDFMVIDLPPGTGDAQLTLTQKVPLSGAVIVTTPQDVALIDARKGLAMFRKVGVPVLGIVENMSSFVCPHCGEVTDIFKKGGGERTAQELECAFLGNIPLDPAIAIAGDEGLPIVVREPDGSHGASFQAIARAVVEASVEETPRVSIQ